MATTGGWLGLDAVAAAREAGKEFVRHTPVLSSRSISDVNGGDVYLKAESLQRTGSFKLRGVLARLAGDLPTAGVTAGSAGNHAQALAFAARAKGVPCQVFMPAGAPISKVSAVQSFGGTVVLGAATVEDCVAQARQHAQDTGALFVHPFDDPLIVAGHATLGLELLEDLPELATVVVPVGGGGLISGVAGVVKDARPKVKIIGVRAAKPAPTIADGIAVKHPGEITQPLVDRWVDEIVTVQEDDIAEAMVLLTERAKLVVEGAGAVGVAALLSGELKPAAKGTTVFVLSGGNVDSGLLATVISRHEATAGRRLRVFTKVPDRPGGLADLLSAIADTGANLVNVEHVRESADLHVRDSGVLLALETRGGDHSKEIVSALAAAGYVVRIED
jgi:threonine dehydratase